MKSEEELYSMRIKQSENAKNKEEPNKLKIKLLGKTQVSIFLLQWYVHISSLTSNEVNQKLCLCNRKEVGLFTNSIYENVIGVSRAPVTFCLFHSARITK